VSKRVPDNVDLHQQLGLTLKQQGNLEGAIAEFEAALNLDSEHREAYYNLGTVLRQQAAEARRGHPAARVAPAVEARLREAAEALSSGDRKGSRSILERAARDTPSSAEIWNLLGFVHGQDRDLLTAIATLRPAVEL